MFIPLLFITVASGLLLYSFLVKMLSWLTVAVAALFYTQGARGMLLRIRRMSDPKSQPVLSAGEIQLIAAGYLLSALVSLLSWLKGEGWLGFIAAGIAIFSAALWIVASRRLRSME
jgi:hypothetical protein